MIKLADGFTLNAIISTAVVNYNNDWHKVIVVESNVENIASILSDNKTFEYDNLHYTHDGLVKDVEGFVWLKFKSVDIIADELAPIKDELTETINYVLDVDFRLIMIELGF